MLTREKQTVFVVLVGHKHYAPSVEGVFHSRGDAICCAQKYAGAYGYTYYEKYKGMPGESSVAVLSKRVK